MFNQEDWIIKCIRWRSTVDIRWSSMGVVTGFCTNYVLWFFLTLFYPGLGGREVGRYIGLCTGANLKALPYNCLLIFPRPVVLICSSLWVMWAAWSHMGYSYVPIGLQAVHRLQVENRWPRPRQSERRADVICRFNKSHIFGLKKKKSFRAMSCRHTK